MNIWLIRIPFYLCCGLLGILLKENWIMFIVASITWVLAMILGYKLAKGE